MIQYLTKRETYVNGKEVNQKLSLGEDNAKWNQLRTHKPSTSPSWDLDVCQEGNPGSGVKISNCSKGTLFVM